MKVLAIDTSNYTLGVALADSGNIIGEHMTYLKKNHSVRLMPAVENLLAECDTKASELSKLVVAKGPGSYTGVRIGVTVAKTMAWTLQIPLVGISSLEVLAGNGRYFEGNICPLFDARRGQIYTGLYKSDGSNIIPLKEDTNVLATTWAEELKNYEGNTLFIGNDSTIHKEAIQSIMGEQAIFSPYILNNPRPSELIGMAENKENEDLHSFVPNYVRLVEAEKKWLEANKNSK
ncbi:tRNA (adenosine(37)-N6)-threonylcarbamoyltransferase complex dimerization subunit type 1 TsaB [Bacillus sp. HMF5848]|uniref:tRNA (adenosine(37)-N6)-threonylcarbamoyltransferase complex dimerization subunit type 1 TsaB n=1 Tax=Bacillus sp. HMF5848 TaxID=2495421 RepID=UPI000F78FCCC|nr:tRNA (adenosine(37)-N6)-threonylcarbamoyltransferase complex dimerization subunit type 1 TsaB [Bacillus sp. HMF5848]RSK25673.1 tRNA (adenosine(37)-N6)-threonylcarbamoyltransferase complex dimerization subunit type 1 TsaB [Bacillus sp. HMF5848]